LLNLVPVTPFDELSARSYAIIRTRLENEGVPIRERDTQIAAIAVANKLVLVTHDVKEFRRIDGLRVEDWAVG
jgi:tRNA(fMet)-specific endonuclease VapC